MIAIIHLAQHQAILQPAEIGFTFTHEGYGFSYYAADNTNFGEWAPFTHDRLLKFQSLPNKISLELIINDQYMIPAANHETAIPDLVFFSSGDQTPFVINIGIYDHAPLFRITGTEVGEINFVSLKN